MVSLDVELFRFDMIIQLLIRALETVSRLPSRGLFSQTLTSFSKSVTENNHTIIHMYSYIDVGVKKNNQHDLKIVTWVPSLSCDLNQLCLSSKGGSI